MKLHLVTPLISVVQTIVIFTTALPAQAAALTAIAPSALTSQIGADWPGYNGDLQSDRFSPLTSITRGNVGGLKRICTAAVGPDIGFETGPIVIHGVLYATTIHATFAFDAATCAPLWASPTGYPNDSGLANRGAAYVNGLIVRGTIGNHVLGINAKTGATVWDVQLAPPPTPFITAAPIAWRGVVFIGLAGGDDGAAGKIFALDANTGATLWTAATVPADPVSGTLPRSSGWGGASVVAGGATWTSYTLDPARGLLLVSTGNPAPDFFGDARLGDNASTDSLLVLDAFSGQLLEAHEFDRHDVHDWDIAASAAYVGSTGTAFVAGKDGLLRRIQLGHPDPVWSAQTTTVDYAPAVPVPGVPVHFCPGSTGGTEWNGPAYSPVSNAVFVNSVDWCNTVTLDASITAADSANGPSAAPGPVYLVPGAPWTGAINYTAAVKNAPFGVEDPYRKLGHVTAVDASSGRRLWQYNATSPVVAGITPTASGLVLTADLNGNFFAFDASSGHILRQIALGQPVGGGVITYAAHAKQYVAVAAGMTSPQVWSTTGTNQIIVLGL